MSTTWSTGFLNETEASGSALAMDLQAADAYVSRAFSLPPRPLPIHLSELILWSPTEVGHLTLWPRQARLLAAACASLPNLRRLDVKLLSPPPDDEPETGLEATLDALDAFPPCTGVALQLQPLRDAPPSAAPPFPTAPFRRLVARIAADGQPSRPPAASIVCMLAVWCRLTEENVTALADAAASAGHRSPLVALRLAGNVMSPLSSAALARAVRLCASLKELDVSHAVVARGDATAAPPGFYAPLFRAAAARAAGGAHVVLRTAPVLEA